MTCMPPNEKIKNSNIGALIKKQKKASDKNVKVLLLGTGDSGKSTVFKQMKFLYGTEEENSVTKGVLKNGITTCLGSIIGDMKNVITAFTTETGKRRAKIPEEFPELSEESMAAADIIMKLKVRKLGQDKIEDCGYSKQMGLRSDVAEALKTLWNDDAVQRLWETLRSNLEISESFGYFADKVAQNYPEFGGKGWSPNDEEFLLTRSQTTGVHSCKFSMAAIRKGITNQTSKKQKRKNKKKKKLESTLELIDVGGQVAERRKWIKVFEGVPVVLFVTAISEYDQTLWEHNGINRLIDSFTVFKEIIHNEAFVEASFIMFLNKSDIFRDKLCEKKIPLNVSEEFPDAPKDFNFEKGVKWIEDRYQKIFEEEDSSIPRKQTIIYHITTATDNENAKVVLQSVAHLVFTQFIQPWVGGPTI